MRSRLLGARAGVREVLCIGLALSALVLQTGRVSSQSNLVAAWSFNEGAGSTSDDRSANDHTATLSGAVWTTGQYGSGLAFDGVDDIVTVADANPLDLSSAFTIQAWVRPEVSSQARPVVRKDAAGGVAYSLSLTTDSKARIEVVIGGTPYTVTGATVLTDLTWTHLAATYTGSQLLVWVNGVQDGSASVSGSISATTQDLSIGGSTTGSQWFPGKLDEVRLYNVALSESQINVDMGASIDDLTPPTITESVPANGTINVHPSSVVTITFSESLNPTTVSTSTVELRDPSNALVSGVVSYDDPSKTATFTPAAAIAQLATYTVNVRGGGTAPVVKDVAGNSLASTASWTFTTSDVTPPSVTGTTPTSNVRNASLSGSIQAVFSEAINSATLTSTTFVVKDTRNLAVSGSISYDAPTMTATFTPGAPLLPTRPYTVTLAGGGSGSRVEDLAGNALASNYSWSFMTTVEPTRIGARNNHSVAVDDSGQVWTWGSDGSGERGTDLDGRVPGAVTTATGVTAVAAGDNHTIALTSNGTLMAWGHNSEGQIGDNSQTNRTTPVAVSSLTDVIAVAGGRLHSVALESDGTVWAWGAGGQVGDGTSVRKLTPTQVTSLSDVIAIAAGSDHTLVLKGDGTVWAWGTNTYGQLGDGTTTSRTSPVHVTGVTGVVGIAAGDRHSMVILSDLTLKAWGANSAGQIGDGTTVTPRSSPTVVSGITDVRSVDAGTQRSLAARLDGTARLWGYTGSGNQTSPATLTGDPPSWQIASGLAHTLFVTSTGTVSAAAHGQVLFGQIGDGTTTRPPAAVAISEVAYAWKVATPEFNVAPGTYNVVKVVTVTALTSGSTIHYTLTGTDPTESDPTIASGGTVTIDETRTLKAKAWKTGQPESNVQSALYTLQVALPSFSPIASTYTTPQSVSISTTSPGATIRYTTDGSTPTEASTAYTGPISIGTFTVLNAIGFRANWQPSTMRTGTYSFNFGTLAAPTLDPAGGTYTSQAVVTMSAMSGAVIRYTTDNSTPSGTSPIYTGPVTVSTTQTLKARAFHIDWTTSGTTTQAYTIVVATPTLSPTSGTYAAGQIITLSTATSGATLRYTLNGIDPTANDPPVPSGGTLYVGNYTLKVAAFKTGATTSAVATGTYQVTGAAMTPRISAGYEHSLAIRSDGVMFAWGSGSSGQLGNGGNTRKVLPTVISGVTGATHAAGGQSFSLAAGGGQQPWSWGSNGNGQLGDNSTTTRFVPVQPTGLANVVAMSGGVSYALALKSDGTLVGWGMNSNGQIGDGTTTQRLTAVAVSTLTNVTAVAAANGFSLAVKSDGTAWSWGNNGNGQLGTGNTTSRTTPGSVSGMTTATGVSGGSAHGLARLSDGTVRAWGFNGSGQLGDGTLTQRTSPITVTGLTNIVAVAAGESHSLALDSSGVVWAWGNNGNGSLGDGSGINRTTPVSVSGLPMIAAIGAGAQHSLALGTDGSVWSWGRNNEGQLGDGTQTNRWTPVQIADAGMAWKVAQPVFSVGSGLSYATFNVTITEADAEAVVRYTTDGNDPTESSTSIASGGSVSIAQTTILNARAFKPGAVISNITSATYELKVVTPALSPGTNWYASTQNVSISTTTPGASITYTLDSTEPTSSSTAYSSAIAVSDTRTVKARAFKTGWTSSDSGFASYWISAGTVPTPTITPAAGSYPSLTLATLAVATTGATLRYTLDGSDPTTTSPQYQHPLLLTSTTTVKARALLAGYTSSAVATATFTIDPSGQSGRPTITPRGGWFDTAQAVTVSAPGGATVRYTLTGVDPTTSDPEVPPTGLTIDRSRLLKVRAWASGQTVSAVSRADFAVTGAVAAGEFHSLVLTAGGVVWAWGDNNFGQIGDGTGTNHTTPVQVLTDVKVIAAGRYFSLAIKQDGTVWRWGEGTGPTPTQISGLTDAVAVAAGHGHQLAVKADGTVWAWGDNSAGQLGDGTTTTRTTPVQVIGLRGVRRVAAGEDFSLAVEDEGAAGGWAWAWGVNNAGQLADGTTLPKSLPTRIANLSGVADVAAGRAFGLARLADGTVRAWGDNQFGQLGIGHTTSATGMHIVQPLARVRTIAAGPFHGIATDVDGRLWTWGQFMLASPNLLPQMPTALAADTGFSHSTILRADGSVWAMGSGTAAVPGGAGDGTQVAGLSTGDQTVLTSDQDNDGVPTWRELARGTDPLNADSNGNGLTDLVEIDLADVGANPDPDGDGVASAAEAAVGTDPFLTDTDGDGFNDGVDAFPLDSTRHDPLTPTPGDTTPPVITLIEPTNAVPIP
ncbi:MAG TPA: chitobiase/beta-hexosaminidase C-terminal domain-containing protein [Vicinamibacterales bacterium]|nr:chitobiase/beta-hexosaminidase C-terminal domain-containing protein [Vicinamibacterales bacterium]